MAPAAPASSSAQANDPGSPAQEVSKRNSKTWLWVALVAVVLAVAIGSYFYFKSDTSTLESPVAPSAAPPNEAQQTSEPIPEIAIEASPEAVESEPLIVPTPPESVPASPKTNTPRPSVPKGPIHLDGSFYLFGNSISPARNYRMAYTVLNTGVAADNPYAGQVKSQVFRVLVDCKTSRWGYDQLYYHARPFGEGERLFEQIWSINKVKFKPFRDSAQDQRLKELICR